MDNATSPLDALVEALALAAKYDKVTKRLADAEDNKEGVVLTLDEIVTLREATSILAAEAARSLDTRGVPYPGPGMGL